MIPLDRLLSSAPSARSSTPYFFVGAPLSPFWLPPCVASTFRRSTSSAVVHRSSTVGFGTCTRLWWRWPGSSLR
ncbi:Protein of unknown function [Pyronema omphalodes CBS 100304]|uniref:Uncharacterized protein n=1 Tax=Pyronema omphalodes (strain CBS 100304) TaxID=1076935 RepID=U4L0J8_PYROM|nr:Protein of unknown function [Pyronema omphalodes CBS 100304]